MIETTVNKVDYKGDGTSKVFAIPFPFIEKEDLTISLVDEENNTTKLTEDFFIDQTANTVTYPGYAAGEEKPEAEQPAILAEGKRLIISRNIPIDQTRDLGTVWPFDEIEKGIDKLTLISQDMSEILRRSFKLPLSADQGDDNTLPYPEEGNVLIWKGSSLVNYDIDNFMDALNKIMQATKDAEAQTKTYQDNTQEIADDTKAELKEQAQTAIDNINTTSQKRLDEAESKIQNQTQTSINQVNSTGESVISQAINLLNATRESQGAAAESEANAKASENAAKATAAALSASVADDAKTATDEANASADSAKKSAASAKEAEDWEELAAELYRRWCVDIVGPPAASMSQADLIVAPGAAAMAAMES